MLELRPLVVRSALRRTRTADLGDWSPTGFFSASSRVEGGALNSQDEIEVWLPLQRVQAQCLLLGAGRHAP